MSREKIKISILTGLFLLAAAYAVYQFTNLSDEFAIEDKDALAAVKWLRLADKKNFAECRKNTGAKVERWFDLFQANRESLDELISRRLKSKTGVKNGIYKIVFNSAFQKAKKIYETVWISKDAKVFQVKYSYLRTPYPRWRSEDTGTYRENEEVRRVAKQAINAMKALDVEFFDQIMLRGEKFRLGKRIVARIKKEHEKSGLPYKCQIPQAFKYTRDFPGRTELDGVLVYINCLYKVKGKPYRRGVVMVMYKDNSSVKPRWEIYRFSFRRLLKQRPRKRRTKRRLKNDKK